MVKKSRSDADAEPASSGDAQRSTDLVIAPEKKTPKLETSKWPLLLKVSDALRHGCKQLVVLIAKVKNTASTHECSEAEVVHVCG